MKIFSKEYYLQKMNALVADEEKWSLFQNACVILMFGVTSLVMTVVNLITQQGFLLGRPSRLLSAARSICCCLAEKASLSRSRLFSLR